MTSSNVGESELPNVIDENGCHDLYIMLNSIRVNLNQIVENCFDVHGKITLYHITQYHNLRVLFFLMDNAPSIPYAFLEGKTFSVSI